jgi:hypothetical protein
MTRNPEFGNVTGTKDKDYDIIWFTEVCLSNVLRLETHPWNADRAGCLGSLASDHRLLGFRAEAWVDPCMAARASGHPAGAQEHPSSAPTGGGATATRALAVQRRPGDWRRFCGR